MIVDLGYARIVVSDAAEDGEDGWLVGLEDEDGVPRRGPELFATNEAAIAEVMRLIS